MKKNTYIKDLEFFGTQYDGNTILQSKLKKIAKHPSSVMALAIRFEEFNKEHFERSGKRWQFSKSQDELADLMQSEYSNIIDYMESKSPLAVPELYTNIIDHSLFPHNQDQNITLEVGFISHGFRCLWQRHSVYVDDPVMAFCLLMIVDDENLAFKAEPIRREWQKPKLYRFHPERFKSHRSYLPSMNELYKSFIRPDSGVMTLDQLNKATNVIVQSVNEKMMDYPVVDRLNYNAGSFVIESEMALSTAYSRFNASGRQIFEFGPELIEMLHQTDVDDVVLADIKLPYKAQYLYFGPQDNLVLKNGWLVDGAYIESRGDDGKFKFTLTAVPLNEEVSKIWFLEQEVFYSQDILGDYAEQTLKTIIEHLYAERIDDITKNKNEFEDNIKKLSTTSNLNVVSVKEENDKIRLQDQYARFPVYKATLKLIVNALCFISAYPDEVEEVWPSDVPKQKMDDNLSINKKKKQEDLLLKEGYRKVKVCGRSLFESIKKSGGSSGSVECHWRKGHWRNQPYGEGMSLRKMKWIKPMIIGAKGSGEEPKNGHIYDVS